GWAQTYLAKATFLERTGRERFQISQRGLDVLEKQPERINLHYLAQFPEFVQFRSSSRQTSAQDVTADLQMDQEQTPQELLESSYQLLRRTLAQELLDRIKADSPRFFETLVVD